MLEEPTQPWALRAPEEALAWADTLSGENLRMGAIGNGVSWRMSKGGKLTDADRKLLEEIDKRILEKLIK